MVQRKRDTATVVCITQSNPIAANLAPVVKKVSHLIQFSLSLLSEQWEGPPQTERESKREADSEGDQENKQTVRQTVCGPQ